MAEALINSLAWPALRLTSSLVSAGWKVLTGDSDRGACYECDGALVAWGADIIIKARDRSSRRTPAPGRRSQAAAAPISTVTQSNGDEVREGMVNVSDDVASLRETMHAQQGENIEFLHRFNENLQTTQLRLEGMQRVPLKVAQMALIDFDASEGDVAHLETARNSAMQAFAQGDIVDLDARLSAGIIAVVAGYVRVSRTQSPASAKSFTFRGTLKNIVSELAYLWADPARVHTPDGQKTLLYLLDLVSCVFTLPPEDASMLSTLDGRLLPALGQCCAAEPTLSQRYPEVGGRAVKGLLTNMKIQPLCLMAGRMDVDIDYCDSKAEIVQALLGSGKALALNAPALTFDAATDRKALMALYNAAGGPSWMHTSFWGTAEPLFKWHGVTTGGKGRVVVLDLGANNLTGGIPPELGDMNALHTLRLVANKLGGAIPAELGRLTALRKLYLHKNELVGVIPSELGRMTALKELCLYMNALVGVIPSELGRLTALKKLYLHTNALVGSIPTVLGKLSALEVLALSENELTGVIPAELGWLIALKDLYLYKNKLVGIIPAELGRLTALKKLRLYGNALVGAIPAELGNLAALEALSLSQNDLVGVIPAELGRLAALKELYLYRNKLSGAIPAELGKLSALRVMALSENELSGVIPAELGRLAFLKELFLHANALVGVIPAELGRLAALKKLYLHSNRLDGAIPAELGNLAALEVLALAENGLTGVIPAALGKLAALKELHLYKNALVGAIPAELGNLAALEVLALAENGLTGVIPAELGRLIALKELYIRTNALVGPMPYEIGNLTALKNLHVDKYLVELYFVHELVPASCTFHLS